MRKALRTLALLLAVMGPSRTVLAQSPPAVPLDIMLQPGRFADPGCYDPGAFVYVRLGIGAYSERILGGRFHLQYDPDCLEFLSVSACPGSPLQNLFDTTVVPAAGRLGYSISIANTNSGTPSDFPDVTSSTQGGSSNPHWGPMDAGCLTFLKTPGCESCEICLVDEVTSISAVWTATGNSIPLSPTGCSSPIRRNNPVALIAPVGGEFLTDCGSMEYLAHWEEPVATSEACGEVPEVACTASHDGGAPIGPEVIAAGGWLPAGTTHFSCTATSSCGDLVTGEWTVNVLPYYRFDVEVQLGPAMGGNTVHRCVNFELYSDCSSAAQTLCETITFVPMPDFTGVGSAVLFAPAQEVTCATAQDLLHTLRAGAVPHCDASQQDGDGNREGTGVWTLEFEGDPTLGGNWLIGGNLDAWNINVAMSSRNTVNILDYVTLIFELSNGAMYPPPGDTPCAPHSCAMAGPHGDINADGLVDEFDFSFVVDNFLAQSILPCCAPSAAGRATAPSSLTINELKALGMEELAIADLDDSGVVDFDDMTLFMQGERPE